MARRCGFVIALAACLWGSPVFAGPAGDNAAKAEESFRQAKELENDGKYREACPLFALSYALDPRPGELFNLAYCYEKEDRIASAWVMWQKGADMAEAVGDTDRATAAREHAKSLKVPHATVMVAPQAQGMPVEVTLDGAPLASDDWGKAIPVDPGEHRVAASSHVLQTWSAHFTAGSEQEPTVAIPALAPAPAPTPPERPEHKTSVLRPIAWTLGGTGLAALGVGAAFGIAGLVIKSASTENRDCVAFSGLKSVRRGGRRGRQAGALGLPGGGTRSYVFGGSLLVTAAAFWLVPRSATPGLHPARFILRPWIAREVWSATLEAAW